MRLMEQMANEPNFCISSNPNKIPLYVQDFLETGDPNSIVPVNRDNIKHLSTLNDINKDHHLDNFMRAYHAHAADNLIVGFDVENYEGSDFDKVGFDAPHRTDPSYLQWFASLPAHYREYSAHYGIHIFYQLHRDKLTDDALDMISLRTEYKLKTIVNDKKLEFELMLNNHWLSITGNTFGDEFIDLTQDAPDEVYKIINDEAARWSAKQADLAEISNVSDSASELAHRITELYDPDKFEETNELTVEDYESDDSRYEFNVAMKIAGYLKWRLDHPKAFDRMHLNPDGEFKPITDNDLIWAVALIMQQILPEREKFNTKRDGLPWLVYNAKKAIETINALSASDEE